MGVAASCRVAYIIVTIVTKGNIGHTSLCKMLDVLKLMFQGKTILNGKHDALTPLTLVFIEVGWGASNTDITLILLDYLLDFIEDKVGISGR